MRQFSMIPAPALAIALSAPLAPVVLANQPQQQAMCQSPAADPAPGFLQSLRSARAHGERLASTAAHSRAAGSTRRPIASLTGRRVFFREPRAEHATTRCRLTPPASGSCWRGLARKGATMAADDRKPTTSDVNGRLWSAGARDWADIQEGIVRKLYETVLERLRVGRGTRYLDAGCGSGLAAQIAASRGAQVSGIDAAESLLAIARERTPAGDFRRGDLEALPYADGSFDAVSGFNSFQFAGNPVVALGEARRVVKPGGLLTIVTWGEPEGMEAAAVVCALRPLIPPPPPNAPGPFALSQEAALRKFAVDAKLSPVEVFD
ncbi:MAG: class I SAM-dependent methyltransferase, partial [Stellaceae bacterium]